MTQETKNMIIKFRNDRNWKQFHNPKDLALSISLEAAELLEVYQWSGTDLECADKIVKVREELADVMIYCTLLADAYNLDITEIIRDKIKSNSEKYPVEKAFGSAAKYTEYEE